MQINRSGVLRDSVHVLAMRFCATSIAMNHRARHPAARNCSMTRLWSSVVGEGVFASL
jgi:hypothetical protein